MPIFPIAIFTFTYMLVFSNSFPCSLDVNILSLYRKKVFPPASSFGLYCLSVPNANSTVLSQGVSDGIYDRRWEQCSEEWITDPKQTNRLQAPPRIIVTRRTLGTRRRLITLRTYVEPLQALKCQGFEQWLCQCQLNKQHVIKHQLLQALLWPSLRDTHKALLLCSSSDPHW